MLTVARFDSLDACAHLRDRIDALNLRSRRPCPYSTFAYYENFLRNDELLTEGRDARVLFLAVLDGDRLVGYAALHRRRAVPFDPRLGKIEWLVTRDTDRPHMVCAPEDEARCARAIVDHLLHDEPRWSYLELGDQEEGDALAGAALGLHGHRLVVRSYDGHAHSSLDVRWPTSDAYFRSLSKKKRETVSHDIRKLMKQGRVEVVRSTDAASARALLPVYLAVEARSWKQAARVGIARHPKRVAFYEGLFADDQPLRTAVSLLVVDGTPCAAMISGTFADTLYLIEIVYDARHERWSPGQALQFFTMTWAVESGFARVNMRSDSVYWKSEWLATSSPTHHVRVIRRPSAPWLLSLAGALRRRVRAARALPRLSWNPLKRYVRSREPAPSAAAGSYAGPDARTLYADVLASRPCLERLDHESIQATLPFGSSRAVSPATR